MKSDVTIQLQHQRWKTILRPYCKTVRKTCEVALAETMPRRQKWEMAVVLADDAFIRTLNHDYRGKDAPTNVLSFPSGDFSPATIHHPPSTHLGDIVLALETIEREAEEQDKKVKHHAMHLLVHGTLHLLGYDHEHDKDAASMEALEIKILKKLKVANPYL